MNKYNKEEVRTLVEYVPECPRGKTRIKSPTPNLLDHPKGQIIKDCIEKGLSLNQIGYIINLTGERIRQIITKCGELEKYRLYRSAKEEIPIIREEFKKNIHRQIGECFKGLEKKLESDSNWAEIKAAEYFYGKKVHIKYATSLEKLIKLFEKYKEGIDEKVKYSYEEIGEYSGIHFVQVGFILRKLNLNSFYWNGKIPTREQMLEIYNSLERAKEKLGFASETDIQYFLKTSPQTIRSIFKNRKSNPFILYTFTKGKKLTYQIASQIFEALDLGFNYEETTSLLNTSQEVIDFAKCHRPAIESDIIYILNTLFPNETHTKPYRS